jgi:hypothetical protein
MKKTKPEQIAMHAKALMHDLEASHLIPKAVLPRLIITIC